LGYKRELVTKWLGEIYQDVFDLNFDRPDLFKDEGLRHELYLKSNHGSATLSVWLKSTPRLYERLDIYFVKAKLGIDFFWVKAFITQLMTANIQLQSGFKMDFAISIGSFWSKGLSTLASLVLWMFMKRWILRLIESLRKFTNTKGTIFGYSRRVKIIQCLNDLTKATQSGGLYRNGKRNFLTPWGWFYTFFLFSSQIHNCPGDDEEGNRETSGTSIQMH